jgi:hypothetical protein
MTYPCPCCRLKTLSEKPPGTYEVCPVCYWEDDPVQFENEEYAGGANRVSLLTARENYHAFGACSEEHRSAVRPPTEEEGTV